VKPGERIFFHPVFSREQILHPPPLPGEANPVTEILIPLQYVGVPSRFANRRGRNSSRQEK